MKAITFAHLADIHLGSFKEKKLKELNIKQFKLAISTIIESKYDFVLISGDIFNVPLPPLEYVELVISEMKKLRDSAIDVFVIGGSHDYSLQQKSFIELLHLANVWTNVGNWQVKDNNSIELLPTTITIKGLEINIYGVLGKKNGLDSKVYEKVKYREKESRERGKSFDIFMFHSTILELLPSHLKKVNEKSPFAYSQSILPKGFDYYAGGHIHHPTIQEVNGSNKKSFISYSGPIFPNSFSELKDTFSGFNTCTIKYDISHNTFEFVKPVYTALPLISIVSVHIVCNKESVEEVVSKVQQECLNKRLESSIVLIELSGEISGKISQLNLQEIVELCYSKGAYLVLKNTHKLKQEEKVVQKISKQFSTIDELHNLAIERLKEFHNTEVDTSIDISTKERLANSLLNYSWLKHEDETQYHYEERVVKHIKKICNIN